MALALFEFDDCSESDSRVFRFCSEACRSSFEAHTSAACDRGVSNEFMRDTKCDNCGLSIDMKEGK